MSGIGRPRGCDRAQSFTLEAVGASVVVLAAVVFVVQATAVTPLSVSTASQHVENQERGQADTLLDHAARTGTLREAVLYWNPDERTFVGADGEGYVGDLPDPPPNEFLGSVGRVFSDAQIAANVYVAYTAADGRTKTRRMLYQGSPSDNAVTATTTLVLFDGDQLAGPHGGETLANASFYASDTAPDSPVYNVVEVRIVVWRM